MALTDLTPLLQFFFDGFQLGGLLCCYPYIIALGIGLILRLINRA